MIATSDGSGEAMDEGIHYLEHCLANPDFYDSLADWDDSASRFALTGQRPPPRWSRYEQELWVSLAPSHARVADQGWKVHVSATPGNAERVLSTVSEHCLRHELAFKFLRSGQALAWNSSKYADRGASGKFCVIYPSTGQELELTLNELGGALTGQQGPYILSDLRWRDGPLYLRYGAFKARYCVDSAGELVPALAEPTGRLVPDVRGPSFRVPDWAPIPPFIAEQIAARDATTTTEFPYRVREALHFSNAGGVYLATDPRTGGQVVLKEARPLAGLDDENVDAVTRLRHEQRTLAKLSDLDVVPQVLDAFTCWEHHFLVEEYIEGEVLTRCVGDRHPLAGPTPTAAEIADFTAWATQVVEQVRDALHAMHERGVVVGDVQPANVIVRPDGRIALVDFELALPVGSGRRPSLGAPGFAPPQGVTDVDVDHYGLACLALWLFMPFAPVLRSRDPSKTELFLSELRRRFGATETLVAGIGRGLRHERATVDSGCRTDRDVLADPRAEDWPRLRASIVEGILASATLDRDDRLFPGDVEQFRSGGGLSLEYGAAGVLLCLDAVGVPVEPAHVEWLVRAVKRWDEPLPGFYNGLHGIAYALDRLEHSEAALSIMADVNGRALPVNGLSGGMAGVGLNLWHFANRTDDNAFRNGAMAIADRLAESVRAGTAEPDRPSAAGLLYGVSGVALFFLHCHRETADVAFLDLAAAALRQDLDYCETGPHDTLYVAEGHRLMPYVGTGTAGIGLVLREFLKRRQDESLELAFERIKRTCRAESTIFPGLFTGHSGQLALAARTSDRPPLADPAVRAHLRRLSWHAQFYRGRLAFPGEQLFRLSTDLATGSAGVLLALATVFEKCPPFLPFLDTGRR